MKNIRKLLVIFISFTLLYSTLFAQESEDIQLPWSISAISGKENKVGKTIKGPFPDKETVFANWIYNNFEPNKKYGITKNGTFVTKNPSSFFRTLWDSVSSEFEQDREAAIAKYNITKDKNVEKNYEKQQSKNKKNQTVQSEKKEKQDKEDSKKKVLTGAIEVNQIVYDENNDRYEVPQEAEQKKEEESKQEVASVEPQDQETALPESEQQEPTPKIPEPQNIPEPVQEPIEETPAVPEIDFSFMMNEIAKNPIQRYSREYIQDYMTPETVPEPEDLPSNLSTIDNPNEADVFGQTLLMKAAKAGNDWQIKTLIAAGADVNLQDKDGWTALMYAVRYQEGLDSVKLLLNAKADVKIKNNFDTSAIVIAACFNNNPELIKTLLNYYPISDKEILKSFVFILSTKQTSDFIQTAKLNVYLDYSIPLNNFYDGKTPLMYAAQSGNSTSVLKLLIENGASTTIRSTEGKTAFDYATTNKNLTHDEIYWSLNRK